MNMKKELTPERRAELRGLAENGGAVPAAVYVPAAELATLLDAADWRDQWREMRHDAVGEASRRWPEGTIRASRWDGIMIDGERSLLVQRDAFVAGAEWVALHGDPKVSLEWDANDEGPPCIDFTCPCGHWRHLCNGPDWITDGPGQVPGVECDKCGRAWSLYRVRITTVIRSNDDQENHND